MKQLINIAHGGLVCSMNPKASYQPGRLDAGICFKRGRKSGFKAGLNSGFKAGMMTQEINSLKEHLNEVPRLNGVELRPYARKYNIRGYANLSVAELRDAVSNAIRQKITELTPPPRRVQDASPQEGEGIIFDELRNRITQRIRRQVQQELKS